VLTRLEPIIQNGLERVFPALSLTILKDGEICLDKAWGVIEDSIPVTSDSLFDLASVTKLFTCTAFLSLVSEGIARLDDLLVSVIPEFGTSGPRPLDGGQNPHSKALLPIPESVLGQTVDPTQVTFRHLLTHTSGLAPWRDVYHSAGPTPLPPDQPDPVSPQERWGNTLRALCEHPFVGQPGEGLVRYSDLGLMLLGEAVSRLHGTTLDETIRVRVLKPLNLKSMTFNPMRLGIDRNNIVPTEDDQGWRGRRCWGEVHDENACGAGGISGHAGLFGTARDLAVFGQAWLTNDPRLGIAPEWMVAAKQEHAASFGIRRGLGWLLKSFEDSSAGDRFSRDSYGHTGFTGTSLWIDPERALVVACLTNRVYLGRDHPEDIHAFRRAIHDEIVTALEDI